MKEGGVYHHDPDPRMEGEWRLGCPVQHHTQGVHSKKDNTNNPQRSNNMGYIKGKYSYELYYSSGVLKETGYLRCPTKASKEVQDIL